MENIVYQKHCEWCGCAFTAQKGSTRYCSHTCASRAYKARTRAGLAQQQEQQFKHEEEQKRLKSFDPATKRPSSVRIRTVVHVSVLAEETLATEGLHIDCDPVTRLHIGNA